MRLRNAIPNFCSVTKIRNNIKPTEIVAECPAMSFVLSADNKQKSKCK